MSGRAAPPIDDGSVRVSRKGGPEAMFRVGEIRHEDGRVRAAMQTGPWMLDLEGEASFGSLAVLLDDVLGNAAVVRRPLNHWPSTTEISVDFAAVPACDGTPLRGSSRWVAGDERSVLSHGFIADEAGRTIAVASCRSRFVEGLPGFITDDTQTAPGELWAPEPASEPPPDGNAHELIGLKGCDEVRTGEADALTFIAGPMVQNPRGAMHGGILIAVSEMAGAALLRARSPQLRTRSVRTVLVRPGPGSGEIRVETTVRHQGRTLGVVEVVTRDLRGKALTITTVIGEPW